VRCSRATGPRKATLRRALEREERRRSVAALDRQIVALRAERHERVLALRSVDLFGARGGTTTLRRGDSLALRRRTAALRRERERIASGGALPFAFASHFGHVHARGGFGLVVGNPPWVRLHNIPGATRASLRERYGVYREAAWTAGAERAGAGSGFGAQVDLAALFVARSLALAAQSGVVARLVPAKLWRSLAGGGTRALLARGARLLRLEDWSEAPCAFDAAVYPSVLVAASAPPMPEEPMHASVRNSDHQARAPRRSLRSASRWRHGASQRAAPRGSTSSGAPVVSCVHRIALDVGRSRQGSIVSPRTSGRTTARSTAPRRSPCVTMTSSPFRSATSTTNASLHPHFTPSVGRPSLQSPSGCPRATTRSNAARTSGGTSSQGLAASLRSNRIDAESARQATPSDRRRTEAWISSAGIGGALAAISTEG
jgi:hypothetical protein